MAITRRCCTSVFIVFMASFYIHQQSSYAYQFNVGGRAGWIVNPPEDYNHWAGRNRFQVNDTLFFKYEKGSNSVLEVNRDDYTQCNINNPILRLEDGNSIFKFDRSGPFYFISGNKTFCDQGQKINIVVLAVRHRIPPVTPPPAGQPPALAPAPASGSPPPAPASGPSISPISPSPLATPPSNAPTPASSSPPPPSSGEAPPPGPSSETTPLTPPGNVTPPPGSNTPANINSSSGASARPAFTPSTVLMSAVTIVFGMTLGAPIII